MLSTPIRLGPFELHGRIGKGGMGEVWRGIHVRENVPVAVKLLHHAKGGNPDATEAFEYEARQVAMMDHPNVVMVFDYGQITRESAEESEGRLFESSDYLVMEYASSGSLDQGLGELSWKECRSILHAVLDALAYTHARGVLHRDIKPGNVLVASNTDFRPGVKLADFGIAHAMVDGPHTKHRAGTPAYMAPEQIRGHWRDFGPPTDLYAVGCLAYKLITGAPPFQAQDATRVMRAHLSSPVPALLPRIEIPEGVERWILTLLQKNPRDRYRFAADAAHALRRLGGRGLRHDHTRRTTNTGTHSDPTFAFETREDDAPSNPTLNPPPEFENLHEDDPEPLPVLAAPMPNHWRGGNTTVPAPRLVGAGLGLYGLRTVPLAGRVAERDRLWQRLRQVARTHQPRLVILQGPSGFGKTRLAEWVAERAHETAAARVLTTIHDPLPGANQGLPRLVVAHLRCSGLADNDIAARVRPLLAERGIHDDYEVEALVRLMTGSEAGQTALTPTERNTLVHRVLQRATHDRPAIVLLDDVQWGGDTLSLVRHVLENSAGIPLPVLFIATVRSDALALRPEEAAALEALDQVDGVDTITIGPLAGADQSLLVQALLGLEPRVAELVERRTAGNPLFAIQLVGDWVKRGVLDVAEHGFHLRAGESEELPEDVFAVWQGRIAQILTLVPAGAADSLEIAAALGREVTEVEWRDACKGAGVDIPDELLSTLYRFRFAESRASGWAFVHAMLRESVEKSARDAGRWPRWNAACAGMLRTRSGRGLMERIGRHLVAAEDPSGAADPLLRGALERADHSAYRAAREVLDLLDETLDHIGTPPEAPARSESALARVRAHIGEGDFAAADALAARTAESARRARDKGTLARALRHRGMIAVKRGDLAVAEAMLLQSQLLATQAGLKEHIARATYHYGELLRIRGDIDGAIDQLLDARDAFAAIDDIHGLADCESALGAAHERRKEPEEAEAHRRSALALFERIGNQFGIASCWNSLGDHLRHRGDVAGAEEAYREALVRCERIGSQARIFPMINHGMLLLQMGRLDDAARRLEASLVLAGKMGRKVAAAYAHVGLLPCMAHAGDWTAWDRHFSEGEALIQESGVVDRDIAESAELAATKAREAGDVPRAERAASLAAAQWRLLGEQDRADAL